VRRPLFLLPALFPVLLCAQGEHHSLLWQVTKAGMKDTTYLFGTMHTRDARAFQFGPEVSRAFISADIVAGELDMEETKKLDVAVMNAMFLPKGTTLDRYYNKRDYKEVVGTLKERLGPVAPLCTKIRPFYTIALLNEAELGSDSTVVLDAWFQQKAQESGKRVVGLETVTEQVEAVERIPIKEQARMLLQVVREEGDAGTNAALEAYVARDLDALLVEVERGELPAAADKALLQDRNLRMVERLEKHMRGHGVFVAVGAAHLPGEYGLIDRLRRLGYTVLPVLPEEAAAPAKRDADLVPQATEER
jgi:uncharacterized protein YbaP (TraB family)